MSPLPRISLVTVNYNYGGYLGETLDSVLNQRYPGLEYIVIDGASTDGSVAEIRARADRLAYWESEPDAGQTHALNKGLRRCTGEIVGFLNSDDLHRPDTLRLVGEYFAAHPAATWLGAPCETIDAAGRPLDLTTVSPGRDLPAWIDGLHFPQPSSFWRRSLHETVGWFDQRLSLCFDQEFWARLVLAGNTPAVLAEPLSRERLHDARKTAAPGAPLLHERLYIAAKFLNRVSPEMARRIRHTMRRQERNLLRMQFQQDGRPDWRTIARWIWNHPDLLRDRSVWGLLRRQLRGGPQPDR